MDLQLLFVLVFVAMSIADAVGRRRKKQERMEEMERQEREGWAPGESPADQSTRSGSRTRQVDPDEGVEEWEWEGRGTDTRGELPPRAPRTDAGTTDSGRGTSGDESQRETADTLVPDDLWAILTGEVPRRRDAPPVSRTPTSTPDSEQSKAEREFEELTTQPWRSGPEREDAASTSPPARPAPIPSSRQEERGRVSTAGRVGRPVPGPRTGRSPLPTRGPMPAPSTRFPSSARSGSEQRPLPDIAGVRLQEVAAGEIGSEGGSFLSPLQREIGAPASIDRRVSGASSYIRDLRSSGREGLRRAIVFQEVLGPPVSLRPAEKRVWEAWEE